MLLTGACSMWGGRHKPATSSGQFLPGDGLPKGSAVNVMAVPDAVPLALPLSKTGNRPYTVFGKNYRPLGSGKGYRAEGIASWYGTKFHGRKTSSGEPYNMYGMSAAHRTLPLPSFARVTNLSNKRSVIVKVNDRGPFVDPDKRIMDLSYAAAARLGIVATGTAKVSIEALMPAPNNGASDSPSRTQPINGEASYLQMGAFSEAQNAKKLLTRLSRAGIAAYIVQSGGVYRVKSGPYLDADQALQHKLQIDRQLDIEARVVFER